MAFPKSLSAKLATRFDELIAVGDQILTAKKTVAATYSRTATYVDGRPAVEVAAHTTIEIEKFYTYRTNVATLLGGLIPEGHIHFATVKEIPQSLPYDYVVAWLNSLLRAVKDDLQKGFLDELADRLAAEFAGDYLTQAEQLLKEGKQGNYDHVPAAVLAGAVLERALRDLCLRQNPPVATDANGTPKTLNPLIDDLKKAGAFNELTAKQLRAWADIRNKAAHGEFTAFSRSSVETMISGIGGFLA